MDALQSMISSDNLSIVSVFLRADWVVKAVLLGLALASVWSWALIIDKLFRIGALNREADRFEDSLTSGRSLEDLAKEAGEHPRHPLPRMLQAALREWRDGRARLNGGDTQAALLLQRIDRAMDSVSAREGARVEDGLGTLAIVATASPFVGLFGTVWGIMHAFTSIAQSSDTSLATVAPGIAEALSTTAIGLVAAIPASIAYNKLASDFGTLARRLTLAISAAARRLDAAKERQAAE